MIHVSDISWTRKINHPSEVLKKGDEVEAVVLEVDKANQRITRAAYKTIRVPKTNFLSIQLSIQGLMQGRFMSRVNELSPPPA